MACFRVMYFLIDPMSEVKYQIKLLICYFLLWKHTYLFKNALIWNGLINTELCTNKCKLKVEIGFDQRLSLFKAQTNFRGMFFEKLFVWVFFETGWFFRKYFLTNFTVLAYFLNWLYKKVSLNNLEIHMSFHLIYFGDIFGSNDAISDKCSP